MICGVDCLEISLYGLDFRFKSGLLVQIYESIFNIYICYISLFAFPVIAYCNYLFTYNHSQTSPKYRSRSFTTILITTSHCLPHINDHRLLSAQMTFALYCVLFFSLYVPNLNLSYNRELYPPITVFLPFRSVHVSRVEIILSSKGFPQSF